MSDEKQQDGKKKRGRRYGENRVFIIGHVVEEPKTVSGKFVTVPVMIPGWVKDGKRQWLRVVIDVFGDDMAQAAKAAVGSYFRATCHLIPRKVKDDNGETKTVIRLQANKDDGIGILAAKIDDPKNPPDVGICRNEAVFLGTYIADKERRGPEDGPRVSDKGDGKKMAFIRLVYNDPKREEESSNGEDEGIWIDVPLFGKSAENAGKYLRHMSVVYVAGEIGVREAKFTVSGKTPMDMRILPRPYGFQYFRQGAAGEKREDKSSGPDTKAYDDGGEQDLEF